MLQESLQVPHAFCKCTSKQWVEASGPRALCAIVMACRHLSMCADVPPTVYWQCIGACCSGCMRYAHAWHTVLHAVHVPHARLGMHLTSGQPFSSKLWPPLARSLRSLLSMLRARLEGGPIPDFGVIPSLWSVRSGGGREEARPALRFVGYVPHLLETHLCHALHSRGCMHALMSGGYSRLP